MVSPPSPSRDATTVDRDHPPSDTSRSDLYPGPTGSMTSGSEPFTAETEGQKRARWRREFREGFLRGRDMAPTSRATGRVASGPGET